MNNDLHTIRLLAQKEHAITEQEVRALITSVSSVFRQVMLAAGFPMKDITGLSTKLRDAGRRSPPWKPTSSRVPGRPQDGSDGNRITRWLLPADHKFYADAVTATLVEVRYFGQLLSMNNAPALPPNSIQESLVWLLDHRLEPGVYLDPIQLIGIDLVEVARDRRLIQSGHIHPLDRGGRHEPSNAFLMLKSSNDLQGNLTVPELLDAMQAIIDRHEEHDRGLIGPAR